MPTSITRCKEEYTFSLRVVRLNRSGKQLKLLRPLSRHFIARPFFYLIPIINSLAQARETGKLSLGISFLYPFGRNYSRPIVEAMEEPRLEAKPEQRTRDV